MRLQKRRSDRFWFERVCCHWFSFLPHMSQIQPPFPSPWKLTMVEVDRQSQVSQVRSLAGQCPHVKSTILSMSLYRTLGIGASFRDTCGAVFEILTCQMLRIGNIHIHSWPLRR